MEKSQEIKLRGKNEQSKTDKMLRNKRGPYKKRKDGEIQEKQESEGFKIIVKHIIQLRRDLGLLKGFVNLEIKNEISEIIFSKSDSKLDKIGCKLEEFINLLKLVKNGGNFDNPLEIIQKNSQISLKEEIKETNNENTGEHDVFIIFEKEN